MPYADPIKQKESRDRYYRATKDDYKTRLNKRRKDRVAYLSALKKEIGCQVCGYNKCYASLDFHHKDESTKEGNVSELAHKRAFSYKRLDEEIRKCVIICRNCHGEYHKGLIDLSDIKNDCIFLCDVYKNWIRLS